MSEVCHALLGRPLHKSEQTSGTQHRHGCFFVDQKPLVINYIPLHFIPSYFIPLLDWEKRPLSLAQKTYASLDAHALLGLLGVVFADTDTRTGTRVGGAMGDVQGEGPGFDLGLSRAMYPLAASSVSPLTRALSLHHPRQHVQQQQQQRRRRPSSSSGSGFGLGVDSSKLTKMSVVEEDKKSKSNGVKSVDAALPTATANNWHSIYVRDSD